MTSDRITLNLDCEVCGLPLRVTIPLHAVHMDWCVTCSDCVEEDNELPRTDENGTVTLNI